MKESSQTGLVIDGIRYLSPREAYDEIEKGALLVDIREDYELCFKAFDVSEAICLYFSGFKEYCKILPKARFIIIADSVGLKSKEAAKMLISKGFCDIAIMNGGICDWEKDSLPMKKDLTEKLTGPCLCQLKPHGKIR